MEALIRRVIALSADTEQTDMYGAPRFEPYPDPDAVAAKFARADAREFYTRFDPQDIVLDSYWGDMGLFDFGMLDKQQEGYAIHGHTHEVIPEWPEDMLVIGICSGDPIMLNPNEEGLIYYAIHGTGSWTPLPIAANIEGFLKLCVAWLDMVQQRGDRLKDGDFVLQADSWALFVRLAREQGIPQEYIDNMVELG